MAVIFSMPSTRSAVRVFRSTKTSVRRGRKIEMQCAAHDEKRSVSAPHDMAHLAKARDRHLSGSSGETVRAPDFLHGRGGHGKEFAADSKNNNLLRPPRGRLRCRRHA